MKKKISGYLLFSIFIGNSIALAENPETELTAEYQQSLKTVLPLTPGQTQAFKKQSMETLEAAKFAPLPTLKQQTVSLNLENTDDLPIIYLVPNYTSAIEVIDETGQPWPIRYHRPAQNKNFSIELAGNENRITNEGKTSSPEDDTHHQFSSALTIEPISRFSHGNLIIFIKDEPRPIRVALRTNSKKVNDTTVIRINKPGPFSRPLIFDHQASTKSDPVADTILDGIPPKDAIEIFFNNKSIPEDSRVWQFNDQQYIRTRHTLRFPPSVYVAHGGNKMRVYRTPITEGISIHENGRIVYKGFYQ
jgi:intracellular multiplication protein IcmK